MWLSFCRSTLPRFLYGWFFISKYCSHMKERTFYNSTFVVIRNKSASRSVFFVVDFLYFSKTCCMCSVHQDVIVFLELKFLGLLNLLEAAGFLPLWLLGRTSEAPGATVLKVFASSEMPTSASVRPRRCLCLCVNQGQTVVARLGQPPATGGTGLHQATGLPARWGLLPFVLQTQHLESLQ